MAKATTPVNTKQIKLSKQDILQIVFWVGVPLLVIIALVFEGSSRKQIKAKYETTTNGYTQEKSGTDKVASNNKHPNKDTIQKIDDEKKVLSDNIFNAWTMMYDDQKSRNRWPRKLPKEFLETVENAKFLSPIGGDGKQHIREDYGYFMVNNLPELIKRINRRRAQVREYQYVENKLDPTKSRFEPVYIEPKEGLLFLITEDKEVFLYHEKDDYLSLVEESDLRDYLLSIENPEPYYREMDPMIANPRAYVQATSTGKGGLSGMGGAGGMGGGIGGGIGGGAGKMPDGGMGGGMFGKSGAEGRGNRKISRGGGSMGGAGGLPGSNRGSSSGMDESLADVPGYGVDPALGGSSTGKMSGGMGDMPGMGGINGMPGGMGGMDSGARGASGSTAQYPGLPPYKDRVRIVGNIDWTSPEIYRLITWGSTVPESVEIWYLQEDLWVYESIISLLVKTNSLQINKPEDELTEEDRKKIEDAKNNINLSTVKCIDQMLIGKEASTLWTSTLSTLSMGGGMGMMAGGMGMMAGGMGMMGGGMGMMGAGMSMMAGGAGMSPGGAGMSPGGAGMSPGGAGAGMGMMGGAGMSPGGAGMGAGMGMMGAGMGMMGGGMGMMGGGTGGQMTPEMIRSQICDGRYLDANNRPLSSSSAPPFAEYNKMPIVLSLVIDQRRIPEFLVNCATSPMPIDVRHIRVRPENFSMVSISASSGMGDFDMGGMGGPSMAGGGMGGGMGGPSMAGGGSMGGGMGGPSMAGGGKGGPSMEGSGGRIGGGRSGGGASALSSKKGMSSLGGESGGGISIDGSAETTLYGADSISIDVFGVIYIYNEPDKTLLGTGTAEEEGGNLGNGMTPGAPANANTPPAGMNTPPAGANMPPAGVNTPPAGMNTPPAGANTPPAGANTPPAGANMPPAGANMPPAGANMPPAGANMPPAGMNTPPAQNP